MKKIALFTIALVATIASRAQIFQPATLYGKYEKGLAVQRILMLPTGCGNPSTPAAADLVPKQAATYFDSCANRYWIFNPKTVTWDSLHVGAVVTAGGPVDWNTQGNNLTSLAYDPKLGATSANDLVLITNNLERARFKASGNFWVSDTLGVNNIMAKPSTDPDYEIVVIPDIQNMVRYNFAYGRPIFDWLRDSAAYYNVKAVLQVGDLTDWNTAAEWDTVAAWFNKIPSSIPVQVAPGNHDYGNGFNPAGRDATRYKAWASSFNSGKSYYVGNYAGSDENYFTKWTVGSKKYMAVGLEFLPRQVVLDWAGHIIDSVYAVEPDREVMIVTHAYIDVYGELATDTSTYSGATYGMSSDNSGQEMWDKLIKKKPSIKWVFNGHFLTPGAWAQVGLADRIVATGENGNLINQLFVNYQDDVNWGDGYFMRMKFQPSKGIVAARYFSAYYSADDSRKPGFVLQNPALSVTTSVAVKGTQSVGEDLRVAGELKVETLTKKTVPYIGEDHVLKSDGSFYFDEAARVPNARGLRINFPRTWASDHLYQNAYIDARDSAGNTIFQIKGSKYDPIPFGETYLANLYIGDSAGYNNPYGWNNIGIGPKALYRAKWLSNSVSETVVMGKRAAYGMGKRNSSYNNVIIGVEALAGDSTFCRFCTVIGQAGAAAFPGGEDMTGVGQAVFTNAKVNSFGSSAIGSNALQNAYAYQAMAVGKGAFGNGDTVINSIAIGARAGRDGKHKGSILIGTFAKYLGDTENELYVDNDGTDGTPELIWGRFINNPMIRIRGDLQVDDTLTNLTYSAVDSSNRVATTAYVKRAIVGLTGGGTPGNVSTAGFTTGFLPYAVNTNELANSGVYDNGSNIIGINTPSPDSTLTVNGSLRVSGKARFNGLNIGIPASAKRVFAAADGTFYLADTSLANINGSTGPTDNRILRSDGTGGSTLQAGAAATLADDGTGTFNGVSIGTYGGSTGISKTGTDLYFVTTAGALIYQAGSAGQRIEIAGAGAYTQNAIQYGGNFAYLRMGSNLQILGSAGYTSIGSAGNVNELTVTGGKVGIGTTSPAASAALEITSTTRGLIIPRMTSAQRDAISSPADWLQIICTDCTATDGSTGVLQVRNNSAGVWKNAW